jgi:hypothetical protein
MSRSRARAELQEKPRRSRIDPWEKRRAMLEGWAAGDCPGHVFDPQEGEETADSHQCIFCDSRELSLEEQEEERFLKSLLDWGSA